MWNSDELKRGNPRSKKQMQHIFGFPTKILRGRRYSSFNYFLLKVLGLVWEQSLLKWSYNHFGVWI